MKIRSPKLFEYLLEQGVLDSGEAVITEAKRAYRKKYKQQWKKTAIRAKKELRPAFTLKEYTLLCIKAREHTMTPTKYLHSVILEDIGQHTLTRDREKLLKILQLVGVSHNLINPHHFRYPFSQTLEYLKEAETLLLEYLNI